MSFPFLQPLPSASDLSLFPARVPREVLGGRVLPCGGHCPECGAVWTVGGICSPGHTSPLPGPHLDAPPHTAKLSEGRVLDLVLLTATLWQLIFK